MQSVTDDLSRVDARDVSAMATYLASLQRPISPERRHHIDELLARATHHAIVPAHEHAGNAGATLFTGACANCHAGGPSLVPPRGIDLALSSAVSAPDPRNAILIILHGIHPGEGQRGPLMPPFENAFTDGQIAALLGYVRESYGDPGSFTFPHRALRKGRSVVLRFEGSLNLSASEIGVCGTARCLTLSGDPAKSRLHSRMGQ
jgi:mono/diheme cytochrome c family protein